ncbi:hypothetical protein IEO21_06675 [Rhodonia placenta]|uniref:Terpene synthase n=1 Tax=Rhodonia placenta TaxID=104341 RepID=A0A8H7U128_9APHY|nr:hypothetical protein IEO21_06675 [Postia placenta]
MVRTRPTYIYLPDTAAGWPFPRTVNPYYEETKAESEAWISSLYPFDAYVQKKFNACDFNHIRTGADLMMLFFVFDEYSDVASVKDAQEMVDIVMDALRNPHKPRPKDENILGEIAKQFWERGVKTASAPSARRFVDYFEGYLKSVVEQAQDREHNRIRSIAEYFDVRRLTVGARPSYALMELGMNIPDEVWEDPAMEIMAVCVTDMIILDNDMLSWNVEQSRGDDAHNIVRIVMEAKKTDVASAMKWVEDYHSLLKKTFLDVYKSVPSWGPEVDAQVQEYARGLGNWVICNISWSFESARYFGKEGRRIREERVVAILDKPVLVGVLESDA